MSEVGSRKSEGRRPPRPTIRFLQLLPFESFPDVSHAKAIAEKRWASFDIGQVRHPLIDDATQRFKTGTPDVHQAATQAAGRTVYEVRSRTGAAWRGAVVCDKEGDPWLVWAAAHNGFHNRVAGVAKHLDNWLPIPAEYKLRAREEAAAAHLAWRMNAVAAFLRAIAAAISAVPQQRSACLLPAVENQPQVTVSIELDHDLPSGQAERDQSMLTVLIRVGSEVADDFIRYILPAVQPDTSMIDSTFTVNSQLESWVTVSQAQLAQIAASQDLPPTESRVDTTCLPLTHLHYVQEKFLAESLILGHATRGICGLWFVPTRDQHAMLPVCPDCEQVMPAARQTADIIRYVLETQGR